MEEYAIDFNGVKTYREFYEAIITGLEAPSWCGKNADAIWDILTGFIDDPAVIYFRGTESLPKDLHELRDKIINTAHKAREYLSQADGVLKIAVLD